MRFARRAAFGAVVLAAAGADAADDFRRLKFNHPGLVVDLGVGLWAEPLPMDFDDDGDVDLLVATADVPSNGLYLFENPGGGVPLPVLRPGRRCDRGVRNLQISHVGDRWYVLTPGRIYPGFRETFLREGRRIPYEPTFYAARANHWKVCDFDGDGLLDLVIGTSDWRDYGWDDAYDVFGEWTHGPLHASVYFVRNIGTEEEPAYAEAVQLMAGDAPLDVFGRPSPNLADWDGDGDLDLVCGEFLDKLTYFENIGTRTEPRYARGRFLAHEGRIITMDLEMILPAAVDWDRDGDVDLVVGQEDGRVALLENTGACSHGMPAFLPPRHFRQEADEVKFGALVTPCAFDWDGDGDEDIIAGNTAGSIGFIENLDGGDPPRWAAPVRLKAGGCVIRIQAGENGSIQGPAEAKWGYTVPTVADWDHDGLPDLVVNSIWGEVVWYRNVGTRRAPELAPARPVEVRWGGPPPKPAWTWWNPKGNQLVTQWRTTPAVVDLDGDGLNDLVMLDHEGYLALFRRMRENGRLRLLPGERIFLDEKGRPLHPSRGRAGRSGRRKFVLADWDGDGKLDILIDGKSIDFLKNVSADGGHRFRNMGRLGRKVLAGHTTCPTIVDWDRNGIPDLLVGAEDGFLYHLRNPRAAK